MSDKLRLPDELAACEARLAAQSLPTTAINRDELLYRAGWAACEARLAYRGSVDTPAKAGLAAQTPESRWAKRRMTAICSLSSAAAAASIAVAVTLEWQHLGSDSSLTAGAPTPPLVQADRDSSSSQSKPAPTESIHARFATVGRSDLELLVSRLASSDVRPGTMTAVSGIRAGLVPSESDSTNRGTTQLSAAKSKSARQLLEEILPTPNEGSITPSVPFWPWSRSQAGDSI